MYKKSIFKLRNLLALLAIVSISLIACNNEGEKTEPAADTPATEPAPAADTTKKDTATIYTATVKPVPTPN
jgi:hypothetical protein